MLDKIAAKELFWYTYNRFKTSTNVDVEILFEDCKTSAALYVVEFCDSKTSLESVFSDSTIAYCYALLQGLNKWITNYSASSSKVHCLSA